MWQAAVNGVEYVFGVAAFTIGQWAPVWIPLALLVVFIRRTRWFKRVTK